MSDCNTGKCGTETVETQANVTDVALLEQQNEYLKKTVAELRMELAQLKTN